jgi:hypothetical protein
MIWLLRFLIIALFILAIYGALKYILNPKRKLELAKEQNRYYFHDDINDVRKNFSITYKGVIFEGEKYLGTTNNSFDVVSIFVWPHGTATLKGFQREDFQFIEQKIFDYYPEAKIDWKSPIKEFMNKE